MHPREEEHPMTVSLIHRARVGLTVALAAVALAACDPNFVPQIDEDDIAEIRVSPNEIDLPVGQSIDLQALALDATGALLQGVEVTWQSADASIVSIDQDGVVTGVSVGTAEISASAVGITGTATVTVDFPPSIALDRTSVAFSVTAGDSDPADEDVMVTNGGAFTLTGLAVDTITYGPGASDWLMAMLDQNEAPATLTLAATSAAATTAGTYTASVQLSGTLADNSPATVDVTLEVSPGAATMFEISSGDGQTGAVGAAVATPPSVSLTDAFGNGIEGVNVTFVVTAGDGSITGAVATTDSAGVAQVGSWTLGMATGTNQLSATTAGFTPLMFTATAVAGAPARMEITSGNGQVATAGSAVAVSPAVTVFDAFDNGVEGLAVDFTVTAGGGSVTGSPATTDATGLATVGSWTVGATAGANEVIATLPGLADTLTFTATGVAGAAAAIALESGDAQTDSVSATLGTPYAVLVTDANGNPVSGVTVTWAVTGGGGSVGNLSNSDASGIAVSTHTFGPTVGAQTVTATAAGLSGSPVTFSSTATAGAATSMVLSAGNGQTAEVGTAVATAPAVLVTDQFGNTIAGADVTFTVTGGGGAVVGSPAATDASGIATITSWTLGSVAGANALQATLGALPAVDFTATGVAGAAANLQLDAGDGQSAIAGNPVSTAPSVLVVDQFGNPVQGVTVSYGNLTGGGSVTAATPVSGPDGIAAVGSWTLGATAGPNTLDATSAGLPDTITFNANGLGGAADSMFVASGDAQTDTVGATLPTPYTVRVVDTNENGVSGIPITWTVTGGGGSVTMETDTDASGFATAVHVLGTMVGPQTVTAALGGVSGSPLTFTSTATVGAPALASANAGEAQTATVGQAVAIAPSVLVTDQFGNPVENVNVTFAVTAGGGSETGSVQITNASGVATVGSWMLGQTAGVANTLTATPAGLTAVVFSATAVADAAAQIMVDAGQGQSAIAGNPVAIAPRVQVLDQFDNSVQGVTVTFSVASGGGTPTGATPVTDADGLATVGSWTLGPMVGANSLEASAAGVGTPATFTATGTVGPPALMSIVNGNAQTDTVGQVLPNEYSVEVTDINGNPVEGTTVTWSPLGVGSITASSDTDASGIATATRTLGNGTGTQSATASVGGLQPGESPRTFTATAVADAPFSMEVSGASNNQTATVATPVAIDPRVLVEDQHGNAVSGATVTFTVTTGDGSVSGATPQTNGSGLASVGMWTLGETAGTNNNTLTASTPGVTSVVFTASATAGAAAVIRRISSTGGTSTNGSSLSKTVEVEDAFGNVVSGVSVTFNASGAGSEFPSVVATNPFGRATTSWTVAASGTPPSDGSFLNTLTVTASGATGTSFTREAVYSYASDVHPLWSSHSGGGGGTCTGCHGGSGGLTLSGNASAAYDELLGVSGTGIFSTCDSGELRVSTAGGTAGEFASVLMDRLDNDGVHCSGPMPTSGSLLSTTERNIIRAWIRNGAPEN